ncbi:MAG TPA: metallophosphoesterase [Candidatus Deferrimicrobiaceae bacterium]|jgi:hypothetical protein
MKFFFGFFTLAYAGANLYALMRFRRAFGLRWRAILPFLPLFIPLVFAPPIVHLLERPGTLPAAMIAAWAGYTWLGVLFLFLWLHGAADIGYFFFRKVRNYPGRTLPPTTREARRLFLAVVAALVVVAGYSFYEAADIRPEHVTIASDRLPAGMKKLRIAQISDLHVGLLIQDHAVHRVADIVRDARPDLLVSTGDLVDAGFVSTGALPEIFRALDPPLGKYAITGNHEYYAGLARSVLFTERSGFRMLRDEALTIRGPEEDGSGPPPNAVPGLHPGAARMGQGGKSADNALLRILGVDDEAGSSFGALPEEAERRLFAEPRSPLFTLYLKHRPQISPESAGKFDLQLSGHTHNGQLFPFRWIVETRFPYLAGLYDLPGGGQLYTSRGTGTWGPRMRFLSPPEVTIIDVVPR